MSRKRIISPKDQQYKTQLHFTRGIVCTYSGPVTMPQFCPSEQASQQPPVVLVDKCDFLVVLNRLYKIRARQDHNKNQPDAEDYEVHKLFDHFSQSLMRREEFKLAIEIFGYRDIELPPAFSNTTINTLKLSLEGRGQ